MMHSVHRRLDRLANQITTGRLIVVSIAQDRTGDTSLVADTLHGSGIVQDDSDLLVLVKQYDVSEADSPCALLSVSPLTSGTRRRLQ
jgi:hypothetical protein